MESLNNKIFKRRSSETFPSVYFTLISIIQGVGLAILVTKTFEYITTDNLTEHWIRYFPYSIISFFILILVVYEYTWFIGVFRWTPKIWDTAIPFFLGAIEISPMFFLTNPQNWWLLMAFFAIMGALAFYNSYYHCIPSNFGSNNTAYLRTKNTLKKDIIISLIVTLICSSSFILLLLIGPSLIVEIPFSLLFVTLIMFMIYQEERFWVALHKDFAPTEY